MKIFGYILRKQRHRVITLQRVLFYKRTVMHDSRAINLCPLEKPWRPIAMPREYICIATQIEGSQPPAAPVGLEPFPRSPSRNPRATYGPSARRRLGMGCFLRRCEGARRQSHAPADRAGTRDRATRARSPDSQNTHCANVEARRTAHCFPRRLRQHRCLERDHWRSSVRTASLQLRHRCPRPIRRNHCRHPCHRGQVRRQTSSRQSSSEAFRRAKQSEPEPCAFPLHRHHFRYRNRLHGPGGVGEAEADALRARTPSQPVLVAAAQTWRATPRYSSSASVILVSLFPFLQGWRRWDLFLPRVGQQQ